MSVFKRKGNNEDIEPKEAFTILEKNRNNPEYVVLDVRTPKEYNEGYIENAKLVNIKSGDFEEEIKNLDKNKHYFVYCRTGRRSKKALELMKKHGFENVNNIRGGIQKWKSKRLPVEK